MSAQVPARRALVFFCGAVGADVGGIQPQGLLDAVALIVVARKALSAQLAMLRAHGILPELFNEIALSGGLVGLVVKQTEPGVLHRVVRLNGGLPAPILPGARVLGAEIIDAELLGGKPPGAVLDLLEMAGGLPVPVVDAVPAGFRIEGAPLLMVRMPRDRWRLTYGLIGCPVSLLDWDAGTLAILRAVGFCYLPLLNLRRQPEDSRSPSFSEPGPFSWPPAPSVWPAPQLEGALFAFSAGDFTPRVWHGRRGPVMVRVSHSADSWDFPAMTPGITC